jgi:hypothetical protein
MIRGTPWDRCFGTVPPGIFINIFLKIDRNIDNIEFPPALSLKTVFMYCLRH